MKESAEGSIASYKARLENTTNGWLLASAATLGQNSQAVLDNLAKAAEKAVARDLLASGGRYGGCLKDRPMSISSVFTEENQQEDPKQPSASGSRATGAACVRAGRLRVNW